jgi:hypothetical protein
MLWNFKNKNINNNDCYIQYIPFYNDGFGSVLVLWLWHKILLNLITHNMKTKIVLIHKKYVIIPDDIKIYTSGSIFISRIKV